MTRTRLEAFSDGVMAILITIMILELKVPHGDGLAALRSLLGPFLIYALSFIYLGIYWNNHHHLFHLVDRINGRILWANLHLLFWLSLFPVGTAWVGDSHFARLPIAIYGGVLLGASIAFRLVVKAIIADQGPGSKLAAAVGKDVKGNLSSLVYLVGLGLSFVSSVLAIGAYVVVALIWLVPDRRIERRLHG
jgi:uncharacterized membrane protein